MSISKNCGIVGDLFDFIINECQIDGDEFVGLFLKSKVCKKIENKEYDYLIGKSGIELGLEILEEFNIKVQDYSTISFIRTEEYWCGWAISYFHHINGMDYKKIFELVTFEDLLRLYPTLHEADITKFIEVLEKINKEKPSNLKKIRVNYGCSQKELAERIGVPQQTIYKYENTNVSPTIATIISIAKVLKVSIDELVGYQAEHINLIKYWKNILDPLFTLIFDEYNDKILINESITGKTIYTFSYNKFIEISEKAKLKTDTEIKTIYEAILAKQFFDVIKEQNHED